MCTVIIVCATLHAVYTKNTNNIVILLKESNYRNVKSTMKGGCTLQICRVLLLFVNTRLMLIRSQCDVMSASRDPLNSTLLLAVPSCFNHDSYKLYKPMYKVDDIRR